MNNVKTKSRQRKGREPSEKVVFICFNVRRRLRLNQLRYTVTICRVATAAFSGYFCLVASYWLENQVRPEVEGVR